ncbi:hypothetical protein A7U43_24060 [Mycobacterium adipatum]|uniref:DUF998 domain-containing protein n=1 Tax=Mycobacterium adipatum TaxID=1682113 RepID=A0A172USF4_9MYCO|nr:DUF998 domain-containing protein [Mycobacterium adipatum]ANE81928.1 hypothetical protein A7U43_24060 [Mycobacterium adipatum]MBI5735056.1 DUF998 domain-containing protein [Mycolicibacterium neoaurum]
MDRASHALCGWIAVLGAATSVVAILALDAVLGGESHRPGRTLRMATISEYVYTAGGWAFLTGVLALAVGSMLLLVGLIRAGVLAPLSVGSILLSLWVIGLVGVAAFPKHNWEIGPSTSGSIHRLATLLAFVSLPAAVLVIARRHRQARPAVWLAYGSLAWLSVLFGAIVIGMLTDLRWYRIIPLGIVERGIVAFEVGAVLALGIWLIRGEFAAAKRVEPA